ncbi:prolipoprotein diacylglyceryl transferase [Patescibacteria group bacterium]|nr:prolipoprotein diacylglyceryl transferase [Patescibacteria group bacterium]
MWFFNFLHTYQPQPIIFRLGFLNIYWYSLLIVISLFLGLGLILKLSQRFKIKKQAIENLFFYLVIFGFLGARAYHVLTELPYYLKNPLDIFKTWQGGLGIYGVIIVGLIVLYFFSRKHKLSFLSLADLIVPGLILGQAIGRWGNYFNQEIFGQPTSLPWGIPIETINRPIEFLSAQYFHPCFLYESIWNFLVFLFLIFLIRSVAIRPQPAQQAGRVFAFYLILYSFGRFFIEFLRIDLQPMLLGLRLAQVVALVIFILGWALLLRKSTKQLSN